ncbi:MAG TPA: toprim domain-containing protein [Acidiferrobacter sp.]|nr:toprim domain-containing protein [Acidiferrobacter sp.]
MSDILENLLSRLDKVRKSGGEWTALCPAHDDRNPSLSIKEADDGTLLIKCHAGCSAREILAAVGLGLEDLYPEHLRKGRRGGNVRPDPEALARIAKAKVDRQKSRKKELTVRVQDAHNSWNHSPTSLTLDSDGIGHAWVRAYLQTRGPDVLEATISAGVRVLPTTSKASYNPDTKCRAHCILWPIRDPRSGDLVGVQREWGRGHKNKKMQGRHMVPVDPENQDVLHSGYVRFPGFPGSRETLYICEGQVTAAAVAAATGARVIALFDTAGMAKPPRPTIQRAVRDGATRIIIAGDSGAGGVKAALEGLHIIQTWGLRVPIVWTVPPEGKDWADVLEEGGQEAVRTALIDGVRKIPAPPKSNAAASIWSIQSWRPAEKPVLPCATVPVAEARIILKNGLMASVADYVGWLAELDERREQKTKGRLPLAKSWLFKTTTGTGKTTEIKDLINDAAILAAGGAVLALVPTHDQADAYEADGWWHYYGRSPSPACPGYCPNHKAMMQAVEQHHIPQAEFCHKCPNGLKWAEKWADLTAMGYAGDKLAKIEACVWQQHLRDTLERQFVVAPIASFSETLAGWARDGLDARGDKAMRHRLVTVDEHVQMSVPVAVGLPDIDLWAHRTKDTLTILERIQAKVEATDDAVGGQSEIPAIQKAAKERKESIAAAKAALDLFKTLGAEMGRLVGKEGRIIVAPELLKAVQKMLDVDDDDVAAWERLEFNRDGTLKLTPLRAAWAIRKTLEYGDGYVKDGVLTVAGVRPILDRIGKRPIVFFDATPGREMVLAVEAHGGRIIDVIATQHVRIIRHPSRFWGLKAFGKKATPEQRGRAIKQYRALRKLHPKAVLLVHKKVRVLLDPDGEDELLGHWGADHRAHDRWTGRDLVIIGSFFPPMDTWRGQYQAARIAALTGGAEASDWPEWPDDLEMEEGAWISEGAHEVQCKLPLPKNPAIRAWLLETISAELVQAIGRARGANLAPSQPATIHIYGGVPLAGLGASGITVEGYEADDQAIGASRSGEALDARQAVAEALTLGQRTINAIRTWVKDRFGVVVGIDRVRSVMRSLEEAARTSGDDIESIFSEVSKRADAYLHSARGDLKGAIDKAVIDRDWVAAELLDIPIQAQTNPTTITGPPSAA